MLRISRPALFVVGALTLFLLHSLFFSSSDVSEQEPETTHQKSSFAASYHHSKAKPPSQAAPKSKTKGKSNSHKSTSDRLTSSSSSDELDIEIPIDSRGFTKFDPASVHGTGQKKHPIELLIEKGKRIHQEIEAKIAAVVELNDAVEEYEKGWGMKPPRGFEYWYRFTQMAKPASLALPTLYPMSQKPFQTFLAHPASLLRQRVEEYRDDKSVFTFTLVPEGEGDEGTACTADQNWVAKDWHERGRGRVIVRGSGAWKFRSNNTLSLVLPILPLLPQEIFTIKPPLEIAFSWSDGPRGLVHNTFRERSEVLARAGKVWPKAQLQKAEQNMRWTYGWQWPCPDGSPLKTQSTDLLLNDLVHEQPMGMDGSTSGPAKTFIADWEKSADFCQNTDIMGLHNVLLLDQSKAAVEVVPILATCRTMWNSDLLGVPLDGVWENVKYVPFKDKTIGKAFWRGSATGLPHSKQMPWRQSQRERLHFFTHNQTSAKFPLLVDRSSEGLGIVTEEWPVSELNERYTDAGLSGGAVQCDDDETCQQMEDEIDFMKFVRKEDSPKYRYVLDIDGNGWSSRFRRLLRGNNVVLKSTIYPEWFHGTLVPWYHYVPVKLDYTDLYDIMAFFEGAPDGTTPGRVDLAQEIAEQSYKFTQERWRVEDMQSYTFLTILEYWRMMTDDREEGSYHDDPTTIE